MREEKIFTYAFHVESEKEERNENDRKCMFDVCSIRIYGLDKDNNTVCVKVKDFQPYCYIELQRLHMGRWTDHLLIDVKDYLCSLVGRNKPVRLDLVYRKRLYSNETEKYPFLKCTFRVKRDMYILRKEMSKAAIIDNGLEKHELYVGNGIKKLQFKLEIII